MILVVLAHCQYVTTRERRQDLNRVNVFLRGPSDGKELGRDGIPVFDEIVEARNRSTRGTSYRAQAFAGSIRDSNDAVGKELGFV
jgi:hypothetical protein